MKIDLNDREADAAKYLFSQEMEYSELKTNIIFDVFYRDMILKGILDSNTGLVEYDEYVNYLIEFLDKKLYYVENRR
jgi:hypothetical protein